MTRRLCGTSPDGATLDDKVIEGTETVLSEVRSANQMFHAQARSLSQPDTECEALATFIMRVRQSMLDQKTYIPAVRPFLAQPASLKLASAA